MARKFELKNVPIMDINDFGEEIQVRQVCTDGHGKPKMIRTADGTQEYETRPAFFDYRVSLIGMIRNSVEQEGIDFDELGRRIVLERKLLDAKKGEVIFEESEYTELCAIIRKVKFTKSSIEMYTMISELFEIKEFKL